MKAVDMVDNVNAKKTLDVLLNHWDVDSKQSDSLVFDEMGILKACSSSQAQMTKDYVFSARDVFLHEKKMLTDGFGVLQRSLVENNKKMRVLPTKTEKDLRQNYQLVQKYLMEHDCLLDKLNVAREKILLQSGSKINKTFRLALAEYQTQIQGVRDSLLIQQTAQNLQTLMDVWDVSNPEKSALCLKNNVLFVMSREKRESMREQLHSSQDKIIVHDGEVLQMIFEGLEKLVFVQEKKLLALQASKEETLVSIYPSQIIFR